MVVRSVFYLLSLPLVLALPAAFGLGNVAELIVSDSGRNFVLAIPGSAAALVIVALAWWAAVHVAVLAVDGTRPRAQSR